MAKKASTVESDRSRVDAHIRPLLGQLKASEVKRSDSERSRSPSSPARPGAMRSSIVRGGKGVVTRVLGMLGAIFA